MKPICFSYHTLALAKKGLYWSGLQGSRGQNGAESAVDHWKLLKVFFMEYYDCENAKGGY